MSIYVEFLHLLTLFEKRSETTLWVILDVDPFLYGSIQLLKGVVD